MDGRERRTTQPRPGRSRHASRAGDNPLLPENRANGNRGGSPDYLRRSHQQRDARRTGVAGTGSA